MVSAVSFSGGSPMSRKRRVSGSVTQLGKPNGVISARVEAVGPDHFGIVSVDCAKERSRWMLCDFYGKVLIAPQTLEHAQGALRAAMAQVAEARKTHHLGELIVALERTGVYHLPVQRAFRAGGYETRVVHPFASQRFRQVSDPGNKTDDTDLAGIHRATVSGFGLLEAPWDDNLRRLQLVVRHRRDLVFKRSQVCCQLREHLHAALPGYAACFDDLWDSSMALPLARPFSSAKLLHEQGVEGLRQFLRERHLRCHTATLDKVVAWSQQAPPADPDADLHHRIWQELDDDRTAKSGQIQALEGEIAGLLARTPYVLLLAIPGINVISAGELAGEMGPIDRYANANHITGRAGLFPSRYQSDRTDRKGKLIRTANMRLRAALLQIADNLVHHNDHFRGHALLWRQRQVDERLIRTRIAKRFSRIAYAIVAGRQLLSHPCCQRRHYIIDKLQTFQLVQGVALDQALANLNAAIDQLPQNAYHDEATPLSEKLRQIDNRRTARMQPIGQILPQVLARLLGTTIELRSEDRASNEPIGQCVSNA
jgi:transposase